MAGTSPTRTLLIVDDEIGFLDLLRDACRDRGYQVATATTTDQGIEVAVALQPSLVLLDVMMPGGSGWEALERLAAHPRSRRIPIIMMSGGPMPHPVPCRVTPTRWLEKPFTPGDLFQALDEVLGTGAATAEEP